MSADSKTVLVDPGVVARLMAQPLVSRFPMEGNVSGHHKSPHRGSSVEFAEYRQYVPGDDTRRLDWRVLARTDRYYLKEFEAETNLRCYLVLDSSASMGFAGNAGSKLDYARRLIATLAYLVIRQGDAAGLLCVGRETVSELPPSRQPSHLQLILGRLETIKPEGETGLAATLHEMAEKVRRRAMVVVFSDLFCDVDELMSAFQHLRFQKHDLVVFQLLDRQEIDFKFERPVRFVDLESHLAMVTEPSIVRREYLRLMRRFLETVERGCHEFSADYRQVLVEADYEKVLATFLVDRARFAAVQ